MTYRELHLMMKTVEFSKRHAYGFPNIVLALTFLLKVFIAYVFCVPKLKITHLKSSNSPLVGNYPQVKNFCPRGYLYQDPTPGVMQTERVCLHSQTLSIIVAFGLLLRFLELSQLRNLSLARFAILALSLACLDCLTSK